MRARFTNVRSWELEVEVEVEVEGKGREAVLLHISHTECATLDVCGHAGFDCCSSRWSYIRWVVDYREWFQAR